MRLQTYDDDNDDDNDDDATNDDGDDDGNGAMGDDLDDGDDDIDDNCDGATGDDVERQRRRLSTTMMAKARRVTKSMMIATARRATTSTTREAEAVQRDATRQPAGESKEEGLRIANKEVGSRMDACGGGCAATKGDARRRHATAGDATTSWHTRGKWEERRKRTRGDRASIGQGCTFRGGDRVKRMRGGGINATTSWQRRDFCGGGKGKGTWSPMTLLGHWGWRTRRSRAELTRERCKR